MPNWLVGILQVIIPAGIMFAETKGWLPQSAAIDLAAILTTIGAAGHSAMTTNTNILFPKQNP